VSWLYGSVDRYQIKIFYSTLYLQVGTGARSEKIRTYNYKVLNVAAHIFLGVVVKQSHLLVSPFPIQNLKSVKTSYHYIHNKFSFYKL